MTGHTDNSVVIRAPFEPVWQLTNDVQRWPELFTEYASVEILDCQDSTWRFRLTMHPDPQGNAWSWVSERTLDRAARRVTARRIEPGWFEYMNITWTYSEVDGGTAMRWVQDFRMRPDSPLDDAAMTERINTNSRVQMDHIREAVERLAATPVARPQPAVGFVRASDVPANRRRGGDIRTVLAPSTVGSTSGFLGTVTLQPGELVTEHYHPYSEEFLYLVTGELTVALDGVEHRAGAGTRVFIPIGVRHRLVNRGSQAACGVFHLSPLAPRPELGHVDTESLSAA